MAKAPTTTRTKIWIPPIGYSKKNTAGAPPNLVQTPIQIRRQANAQVDLATRPQLNAYDQQIQRARVEGKAVSDRAAGFATGEQGYLQLLGKSFATSDAASAGRMQTIGNTAQQSVTAAGNVSQANSLNDASVRGPGLDGGASAQLAQQLADAHSRVGSDQQAAQNLDAQTSTAYEGLVKAMQGSAATRGTETQNALAYKTQQDIGDLGLKRADIVASRGPMRAAAEHDIRQEAFTNYATLRGLDATDDKTALALSTAQADATQKGIDQSIKQDGQKETASNDFQNRIIKRAQLAETVRGNTLAHQDRLSKMLHDARTGKGAGLTPLQIQNLQKLNGKIRSAISGVGDDIKQLNAAKDDKGKPLSDNQKRAILLKRYGHDADIVQAGRELHNQGYLNPDTAAALKARHIGVPAKWGKQGGNASNNYNGG